MISRTFDEWSKDGFKIKKGSKGTFFNGKYYFTEDQVEYREYDYDLEYERDMAVLHDLN